jgi:hypothetical protein
MSDNCCSNIENMSSLPCSDDSNADKADNPAVGENTIRPASKYPIKFSFDSPKLLSPADKARSKMLGGPCC